MCYLYMIDREQLIFCHDFNLYLYQKKKKESYKIDFFFKLDHKLHPTSFPLPNGIVKENVNTIHLKMYGIYPHAFRIVF